MCKSCEHSNGTFPCVACSRAWPPCLGVGLQHRTQRSRTPWPCCQLREPQRLSRAVSPTTTQRASRHTHTLSFKNSLTCCGRHVLRCHTISGVLPAPYPCWSALILAARRRAKCIQPRVWQSTLCVNLPLRASPPRALFLAIPLPVGSFWPFGLGRHPCKAASRLPQLWSHSAIPLVRSTSSPTAMSSER